MKKILPFILLTFLIGCSSAPVNYETRTSTSKFDGVVSKGSVPALVDCNEWKEECPVITLIHRSNLPNQIGVGIEINSIVKYYNLRQLSFNIDGDIITLSNPGLTDFKSHTNIRTSSAMFVTDLVLLDKIKKGNRIWIKVSTISDGAFERSILDNGKQSRAYKAIMAFNP